MSLTELSQKYGTDKFQHGYMPYYEEHFNKDIKKMLEIGCLEGASIRMWKEWLPSVKVDSLDLFIEKPKPEITDTFFWKGSQIDHAILKLIRDSRYDVIIDDGSHNSRDQLVSFFSLIGSCKQYVIEDLQCCNEEFYRDGLPFSCSVLGMMLNNTFPLPFKLFDNKIAFINGK